MRPGIPLASLLFTFAAPAQHTTLRFDHLVFFVADSSLEQALTQQLFHPAEKLATPHPGQGTEGHSRAVPEHLHRVPVPEG
ncbi:MAG: hypothetical protein R2810_03695 [Flavobacteriales bacterium]